LEYEVDIYATIMNPMSGESAEDRIKLIFTVFEYMLHETCDNHKEGLYVQTATE